jgi:hypothetical protein
LAELEARWIAETPIVYIGKAGAPGSRVTLRSRLVQYMRFGSGDPVAHWGGRAIWQLEDAPELLVCWRPEGQPRQVEKELLAEFRQRFGRLPFGNRVG